MSAVGVTTNFAVSTFNITSLLCSIGTILYMVCFKLKNSKLLLLQLVNVFNQSLIISYFILVYRNSRNALLLDFMANSSSSLSIVSVFIIALIDCDVLEVFAILNCGITTFRITFLRRVLIALFIVLVTPNLVLTISIFGVNFSALTVTICNIASIFFDILMVIYDNAQAIFLAILVFKGTSPAKVKVKYRHVIITNMLLVSLDHIGLICVYFTIYFNSINYAFIPSAVVGFHSSLILIVVAQLREVLRVDAKGESPLPITEYLMTAKSEVVLPKNDTGVISSGRNQINI